VHVISVSRLKAFWDSHRNAETPLRAWYQVARQATWHSLDELHRTYPSADPVERFTVFNVGGNDFRLITRVEYERQEIYIRATLTHAEYDKGEWKRDTWFQRR
jgi:mRNA interferase HigB